MRAGVIGLMPGVAAEVTDETVGRLRGLGFTGTHWTLQHPLEIDEVGLRRVRDVLAGGGVRVAQAVPRNQDLVAADPQRREQGVRELQRACHAARLLDAATLYVRPGSVNPAGSWTPHPENQRLATLERLMQGLREVCKAAEEEGTILALEGAAVSPLATAETVRDVIDAVGSPALRFNVDPVNFVRGLDDVYQTTSLVNRLFDVCGRSIVAAHAKDVRYENALTVRLAECLLGEGLMDQVTFLRRFEETCADGYVLIEHLPDAQIPAAKAALDRAAAAAGVTWQA